MQNPARPVVDLSSSVWPRPLSREEVYEALLRPFAESLNPHLEAAQRGTDAWVERHQLLKGPAARKAAAARVAWMIAGFYPTAPLERLQVASDYLVWAYSLDDVGDETPVGERPGRLLARFVQFEAVFDGTSRGEDGFVRGLEDILSRLRRFASQEQVEAFHEGNRAYWGAMLWEAKNREASRTPDEEEFIGLRPAAGAVPPFYSIIELMEGIAVLPEARTHPAVEEATRLAGRIMCWINDVLSWEKEDAFGDRHNLVMVLGQSRDLQRADSLRAAIDFCNEEIQQFVAATERIPSFGETEDAALNTYLDALRAMIRVTLEWTYGSSRYHSAS